VVAIDWFVVGQGTNKGGSFDHKVGEGNTVIIIGVANVEQPDRQTGYFFPKGGGEDKREFAGAIREGSFEL
jgi:hypothetical protein